MTDMVKEIKDAKWDVCKISKKSFDGAAMSYDTADGKKIGVAFNTTRAFIIDDEGAFSAEEIHNYIINDKSFDFVEDPFEVKGIVAVAELADDGKSIAFKPEVLEKYGINDVYVKEDIEKRILLLNALDDVNIAKVAPD